ncbi:MAG: WXG100 family type VII secretion target [Ardenticatenaceae bacterium]|nr:WXG100 family type VII secretion target [Anaerolineales bacterium]MCB8921421.1 WXG100 family type VII secretion target [Ardenticatenaceae bacterium]MCB8991538.1 WXG100 family type VII secretion target [Ardenticatenaceae bacterium]MCB9005100.1 WXG100 family type VII secretion target [Ardenticatenaceae bacterium]
MAETIQADYEVLEQIAQRFTQQGDEVEQMNQNLRSRMDQIQSTWQGMGSEAFFAEMGDEVLPASDRLRQALEQAGNITKQIATALSAAEEEAGNSFQVSV